MAVRAPVGPWGTGHRLQIIMQRLQNRCWEKVTSNHPNIKTSSSLCCIMRVMHAHGIGRLHCYAFPCKLWLTVNGIQAQRVMHRIHKMKASKRHFGTEIVFSTASYEPLTQKLSIQKLLSILETHREWLCLEYFILVWSLIFSKLFRLNILLEQMYQSKLKPALNK